MFQIGPLFWLMGLLMIWSGFMLILVLSSSILPNKPADSLNNLANYSYLYSW